MVLNPEYFEGILFQVVLQNDTRRKKKHSLLVAVGGQYDKLVDTFRRSSKVTRESFGGGRDTGPTHYTTPTSSVSVCGVSIREEPLLGAMCDLYNENQVHTDVYLHGTVYVYMYVTIDVSIFPSYMKLNSSLSIFFLSPYPSLSPPPSLPLYPSSPF